MCTLIFFHRVDERWPIVVAANRDEKLDRASSPPKLRVQGDLRIVAPVDEVSGGTWLGLNSAGVFVGITNRFGMPPDPQWRSRGGIVTDALTQTSARAAYDVARRLDATSNNGFHLLMADRAEAFIVWNDGATMHAEVLEPGRHIITERSFDAGTTAREPLLQRLATVDGDLQAILRTHTEEGFEGVCVHEPKWDYGTRSATVLRVSADARAELEFADGPPCETPFVSVTPP